VIHNIRAWGSESSCQVLELLEELAKNANPDASALWRLISETADNGVTRNKEKCRPVQGNKGKGLYEFKARGGTRVLWFYDRKDIICTHGFKNGQPLAASIKTAQAIKKRHFEEKENAAQ
jgi:hypothetical protein